MERQVVRVVTPGTLSDEALLEESRDNFAAAIATAGKRIGIAWLDLSGGRFVVAEVEGLNALAAELERLNPAELLVSEEAVLPEWLERRAGLKRRGDWHFDIETANRLLNQQFGTQSLDGYGSGDLSVALGAAGALLDYVTDTQRTTLPHLIGMRVERQDEAVRMDAATQRNLELVTSLSGNDKHTLVGVLDSCRTSMGSRLLRRWLSRPLRNEVELGKRHQAVETLIEFQRTEPLREALRNVGDVERILTRVALRSARPRDLRQLCASLGALPAIVQLLGLDNDSLLEQLASDIATHPQTQQLLDRALNESPPMLIRDGGCIADGYDAELDEFRRLSTMPANT